ncbi:hypothetical protein T492DRAFT_925262 [Pavlovales sp. CCMP2436]|nr:hypothetical protein T492DRAFT_925262 [Pavlovales sp. CCMP2436]
MLSDFGSSTINEALPDSMCKSTASTFAPLKDRKTGLCTWQAMALYPKGSWVSKREAHKYMGDSEFVDYGSTAKGLKHACNSKRGWYNCPSFNHDKEWLLDIVKKRKCGMKFLTPSMLYNITGRPLKVLLHGDSLFKGTYKSFVCQMNAWVEWEKHYAHPKKESHNSEVWVAGMGPITMQYLYRDGSYEHTAALAASGAEALMQLDEFDIIFTNYGYGSGGYREMAGRNGYNGPISGASHACARCKATTEAGFVGCADNSVRRLDCARRAGQISLDYCTMSLPWGGYKAQWAPAGKVMNTADPHMCSPGPDDQLINHMMHIMASYFRK